MCPPLGLSLCFPQPQSYMLLSNALVHLFIVKVVSVLLYSSFHNLWPDAPMGLLSPGTLTSHSAHHCFQQSPICNPNCATIPINARSQARQKLIPQAAPTQARILEENSTFFLPCWGRSWELRGFLLTMPPSNKEWMAQEWTKMQQMFLPFWMWLFLV